MKLTDLHEQDEEHIKTLREQAFDTTASYLIEEGVAIMKEMIQEDIFVGTTVDDMIEGIEDNIGSKDYSQWFIRECLDRAKPQLRVKLRDFRRQLVAKRRQTTER